jgi:antitoxin HicB
MIAYHAHLEPASEGGFVVTFPEFGWGVTQGETEEEALSMAGDALEIIIGETMRNDMDLPIPSRNRSRSSRLITLPLQKAAKVALYKAYRQSGLTRAQFARRLKISRTEVERLFDLRRPSGLARLEKAFELIGTRVSIDVLPAA